MTTPPPSDAGPAALGEPESEVIEQAASTPPMAVVGLSGQNPPTERGLGRLASRGALVTVGAQLVKIVLQVAGVVVLARLLTPNDYGLVAMVLAIVGIAEIFRDLGLSSAAIQARSLSRGQRDNLFWINTGAGLLLALLVMAGAPLIGLWYGRPELVDLARALAPVFLLNGMATQYRASLTRSMRFTRIATVEIAAPAVALGVAITLGVVGAGPWALIAQQLATAVVLLLGAAISARWLPRGPKRHEPMGELLTFGWQLAGSLLVGYVGNNVDALVIGTRFGPTQLGLYNRAFQLLMTPLGQLRQPTTQVALPILSRLREDREATDRYLERGQVALGLTLVVGLGLVLGAAEPITAVFLGAQWLSIEPILRLLAVAGMFQTLAYVGLWVYLAHGLTKQLLHYTLISVSIKVTCILVGSTWGPLGVAWGYLVAPGLTWPLSFWWLSRSSPVTVRRLILGGIRLLLLTGAVAAAAYVGCLAGKRLPDLAQLGLGVVGGLAAYGLAALVVRPIRRDVTSLVHLARQGLHRR